MKQETIKKNTPLTLPTSMNADGSILYANLDFDKKDNMSVDELLKAYTKLEEENKALTTARDAALTTSEMKSAFLFNMSHDIRTSMNAISGYAEKIVKHRDNPEAVMDAILKLKKSSDLLLNFIDEVLEISEIEAGNEAVNSEPFDIRVGLADLVDMLLILLEKKHQTLETEYSIRDHFAKIDFQRAKKVIFNVLTNSIKYTPNSGTILYKLEQLDDLPDGRIQYQWTIKDNGIGMSKEFAKHAFESFSREQDPAIKDREGNGLGLSVSKNLVELMGGHIELESEKGKGTTVRFTIPCERCNESDIKNSEEITETHVSKNLIGKRILLVDDNIMNREITTDELQDFGLVIDTAANGLNAVERISKSEPGDYSLILMDLQMPVMDGFEATRRIRALPDKTLANIPIVAMTANAFEEDRKLAFEAGMDEYLTKPVLASMLQKVLNIYISVDSRQ